MYLFFNRLINLLMFFFTKKNESLQQLRPKSSVYGSIVFTIIFFILYMFIIVKVIEEIMDYSDYIIEKFFLISLFVTLITLFSVVFFCLIIAAFQCREICWLVDIVACITSIAFMIIFLKNNCKNNIKKVKLKLLKLLSKISK